MTYRPCTKSSEWYPVKSLPFTLLISYIIYGNQTHNTTTRLVCQSNLSIQNSEGVKSEKYLLRRFYGIANGIHRIKTNWVCWLHVSKLEIIYWKLCEEGWLFNLSNVVIIKLDNRSKVLTINLYFPHLLSWTNDHLLLDDTYWQIFTECMFYILNRLEGVFTSKNKLFPYAISSNDFSLFNKKKIIN